MNNIQSNCLPDMGSNPVESTYVGGWQFSWPFCNCYCHTKSAREQVQDEILVKMADAIKNDDLDTAKKLVELIEALKEL